MKVILNKDVNPLGEEGDIKDVAKGYARNYLFPRGLALPYTDSTVRIFETRREEIEARKAEKRKDALGLREKLETLELVITMPAGANGKLYGAVTSQTIVDELAKQGFQTERKRVELPGNSFKSVGKYKVTVKLYENAQAEISVNVQAQVIKTETKASAPKRERRRRDAEAGQVMEGAPAGGSAGEAPAGEAAPPPEASAQAVPEAAAALEADSPAAGE